MFDNGDARVLERKRLPGDGGEIRPLSTRLTLEDATPLGAAMRDRKTIWLESIEEYRQRFPEAARIFRPEEGANAFLAMPLIHGDDLIGGLLLGFKESSAIGAVNHAFAGLLAQSVGNALARARTLEREPDDTERD